MEYTKQELKDALKSQIATNGDKAIKALMTVYSYQTFEEQSDGVTKFYNGVGFSGKDSQILSSFAEHYKAHGTLSEKQMKLLKRLMPRYANQLLNLSFAKGNFEKVGRKWRIVRKTTVRVDSD